MKKYIFVKNFRPYMSQDKNIRKTYSLREKRKTAKEIVKNKKKVRDVMNELDVSRK